MFWFMDSSLHKELRNKFLSMTFFCTVLDSSSSLIPLVSFAGTYELSLHLIYMFFCFLSLPEPMRALRGLTAAEIQPRQLALQWEPLGYNLTRCHTYTLSLCYRYSMPTGGSGGNNATVRECLSVDRNTSHFTLRDLPPFRSVHVRLALANPEGKKESREVTFQTEEDSEFYWVNCRTKTCKDMLEYSMQCYLCATATLLWRTGMLFMYAMKLFIVIVTQLWLQNFLNF